MEAITLGKLIEVLESVEPSQQVPLGFHNPHSYRGYYHCLGFEPLEETTVGEMLDCCKKANGEIFYGWKGGEYKMSLDTECYLSEIGDVGEPLTPTLVKYMCSYYG